MIIWLTGPRYEDLTEIAWQLYEGVHSVVMLHHEFDDPVLMAAAAAHLSPQVEVIVCGGADTIAERYEMSEICNPTWVHIQRDDHGDYEEPDPVKDTFMVKRDIVSIREAIRRIRYMIGYTSQDPYYMITGYFHPLSNELIAKIRNALFHFKPVLLAVQDMRKDDEHRQTVMYRVRALKREFGSSVKIITIPGVSEIVTTQDNSEGENR